MVASMFSLVLFMQLSIFFAASMEVKSKIFGDDNIVYSTSYGDELFYLNGDLVDRVLFCKTIQLHHADHCVFEGYNDATNYCGSDLLSGGRRLLGKPEIGNYRADLNSNQKHIKGYPDWTIILMIAAGVLLTCCICCCCCICWRKRANAHTVITQDSNSSSHMEMNIHFPPETIPTTLLRVQPNPSLLPMSPKLGRTGSVHLTMTEVARATCNFSPELQIGEGGFGTVYKALLGSGQFVAVKRAKKEHLEKLQTEFSSEVELLANIDHRNLVKLLGYVDSGDERLIITEYVPNGTLRDHLDGQRGKILDFNQRLEIAIDVAHGLTYLHLYAGKQIIHRDVKSSNILLTESMRAKVGDFGFAIVGPMDSDQTHISTKLKGTVGYLDPEYMKTYHLTAKSDVYSFGVVLLEILTGRRPVELKRPYPDRVTLKWAFRKYNEGHVIELVDGMMEEVVDAEILMKIFALAFQCAAPTRIDRPQMKSVAEQLWAIRADYLKTSRRR
ncbi:Calmodulin-binding receptor-like cytoplasmic kinase 3 [Hibiscus syriacus]|uniref:non-specific serine/threonine protein kinase n=1 Tax=Hibiscus syriacus TaxID=106335 RepID=A0A6A3BA72_HIBSY|nr:Calmodulin-binding receptor-like cytoplasmic kinase 3 [Hibiscus syriacus]